MNRLIALLLTGMIHIYRHTLSYFVGRHCRFTPTCSEYALEAIRLHGPGQGSLLAVKRLCKCHPFTGLGGKSGFDPVPPHVK